MLKDETVYRAFLKIDRKDFVLEEFKKDANKNIPLPIGEGQTISQPEVVAFMIELLSLGGKQKVLDIGFGSGWTTALLAEIVKQGKVIAIERVPQLYEFGRKNIEKYGFLNEKIVEVFLEDGKKGKEEKGPYDAILVSAECKDKNFPEKIKNQLKEGGRMVVPIGSSIYLFFKNEENLSFKEYPGFSFVPFV